MKSLAYLPLAALALFMTGCGDAPYEGDPAQSQLAAEDAAKRAAGESTPGPIVPDLMPDQKSEKPEAEAQAD